jgi:prepilin-type N-terminal cleavage/methylation domain-containing protein
MFPQQVNTGGTGPQLQMTKPNHPSTLLINRNGFTLIEIIVVLVILSVLGAIAIPRVLTLESAAAQKSIECAVSELNTRECMTWTLLKTSTSDVIDDTQVYARVDTNLGAEYRWSSKTADGGTLRFKEKEVQLARTRSSNMQSANWRMQ